MKAYNRICAKINLDAVMHNVENMHQKCGLAKMMPIIKADGYGHGALQIAEMLTSCEYIWGFGVATLDEALILREHGIDNPILVLGCVFPEQYEDLIRHNIRMTVYTEEMANAVNELAADMNRTVYVHIKIDTGMGRLGFDCNEKSFDIIERISKLEYIKTEGIFTHFAKSDEMDKSFTDMQLEKFVWMYEHLERIGVVFDYKHCANSAAIIDCPQAEKDLIRAGISLYGLYPSEEVDKHNLYLQPALSLESHVVYVKEVEEGTPISYGGTFVTNKKMKIATIPVGYADGYARGLSNKGHVLIRGHKAPIIGRICMDQFMVDVTHIEGVCFGDKVTLIGTDGEETITVEMLGELSGRFNYEFVCELGKRVPRLYVKNQTIVG